MIRNIILGFIVCLAVAGCCCSKKPCNPPSLPVCVGDCNKDGVVDVTDQTIITNIRMGSANITACPGLDVNGNGEIDVDELVKVTNNQLNGCPK